MGNVMESMRGLFFGTGKVYSAGVGEGVTTQQCERCGRAAMIVVARGGEDNQWIVCHCGLGYLMRGDRLYPAVPTLDEPAGLSPAVAAAWREARDCLAVDATIGAATLCRKILFHMAVEEGLPEKNNKDRAPGFEQCVDHLQNQGVITAPMRQWVDNIREVGNQANHDLAPVPREDAERLAVFVHELLRMHYGTRAALQSLAPLPAQDEQWAGPTREG